MLKNRKSLFCKKYNVKYKIQNNFKKYIIVRLPQVIGKSNNNSTLINFLFNSIKNNIKSVYCGYSDLAIRIKGI